MSPTGSTGVLLLWPSYFALSDPVNVGSACLQIFVNPFIVLIVKVIVQFIIMSAVVPSFIVYLISLQSGGRFQILCLPTFVQPSSIYLEELLFIEIRELVDPFLEPDCLLGVVTFDLSEVLLKGLILLGQLCLRRVRSSILGNEVDKGFLYYLIVF